MAERPRGSSDDATLRTGPLPRRVVERYVRVFAPARIVLFGSRAKGTSHRGSDVDLLVIADLDGDPVVHLRRARQLAADCFPTVDVVFATPEEVAEATPTASPFLFSILGRGVTVYRRPAAVRRTTDEGL